MKYEKHPTIYIKDFIKDYISLDVKYIIAQILLKKMNNNKINTSNLLCSTIHEQNQIQNFIKSNILEKKIIGFNMPFDVSIKGFIFIGLIDIIIKDGNNVLPCIIASEPHDKYKYVIFKEALNREFANCNKVLVLNINTGNLTEIDIKESDKYVNRLCREI